MLYTKNLHNFFYNNALVLLINFLYAISLFICSHFFVKKLFSSFFVSSCRVSTVTGSQPMTMKTAQNLYINLTNHKDWTMGQHCSANGIIPFMPNHSTSESNCYSSEQEHAEIIAIKCTTFSTVLSEYRNFFILQGRKIFLKLQLQLPSNSAHLITSIFCSTMPLHTAQQHEHKWQSSRKKYHLGDTGIDEKITLRWIFRMR